MNMETRFDMTNEARQFLEKKLAELKGKVRQSEEALNRFRRSHGVVSVEKGENIVVDRMLDLNRHLTKAKGERIEVESLHRMIENRNSQYLTQVIDNSLIKQLKGSLATLESERARSSTIFKPDHPRLQELNEQINETRRRMNVEIANIVRGIESNYAAARAREEALEVEAKHQQKAALSLKELAVDYTVLQEEVGINRALHDGVLKRLTETNVSDDVPVSNIQITERGETPLYPSSPQMARNIVVAAFFGLFLGVGLAFFVEYLDSSIRTPEEVWQALSLPTFGAVPNLKALRNKIYGYGRLPKHSPIEHLAHTGVTKGISFTKEVMLAHHPFSVISESYRTIRSALLLSQAEKPPQVLLFTSACPGEGKTVTALNLAIALAQDDHSVLLIDADLRKGRCHKLMHVKNHRGLTEVLTGALSFERSIHKTAVDGLSFISRGALPPSPPDLLGSRKMREVVDVLREGFDFILIDSPPLMGISDAAVLSGLSDGVLLVVCSQKTSAATAGRALERLEAVRAHVLGVVLNRVDFKNPYFVDYRYHYSSHYAAVNEEEGQ
jgi:capsular exopolysaccharide synthesis family protein